jgi:fumarylacetoacetase
MTRPVNTQALNETHDPKARSWIDSANGHPEFPLQNLPLARIASADGADHVVTAIGDQALDLTALAANTNIPTGLARALQPVAGGQLLSLMAQGSKASSSLRREVFAALNASAESWMQDLLAQYLLPRKDLNLLLPCRPPTFTDFYSSIHHATNIGALVRPDQPLLPNYKWLPVGYHGRTTSIFSSGRPFPRPRGQIVQGADKEVVFEPSARLDYEAELGFFIGSPSSHGERVALDDAHDHLFGVSMLNDWSARDIQFWEYVPLGPFLGKSFATTLGNWVVTREALEPFWVAPPWGSDHKPLSYLDSQRERSVGGLNVTVEVFISSAEMRKKGLAPHCLSSGNCATSFWTIGQMIAYQTSNGAAIDAGDLIGSGTLSGPTDNSRGCLMEITQGGKAPFQLPSGELRTFVEDGDEITLTGWCEAPGHARIGLGESVARVLPATPL